jgi:hypothetical protein
LVQRQEVMNTKSWLVSTALAASAAFTLIVSAASANAEPAPSPGPPSKAPVTAAKEKIWSKITVQTIKPTLTARNVFAIRGVHSNGVRGGWTLETSYAFNDQTRVAQITLAASAPGDSPTTRNTEPVQATVEIKELSDASGKYDVIVVDQSGKELARTVYEKKS